jgi:UDP-N-acetylglucosamine--N-acetylmuramyl-(pentapeptide) pyrophosphoryl-undecaprenol N-acetylglucosamine transferase
MSTFVLAAGGTGGHLFPAMALAQELRRRGHAVHLMTDERVASYGRDFPADATHIVPSATPSIRNPFKFVLAGATLCWGTLLAIIKLRQIRADGVVGFGGYPTFPPLMAASVLGLPTILHEANAVMGRANRALGRFADVLALSFAQTRFASDFRREKVVTGNPVRDRVREMAAKPYPLMGHTDPIRLSVFGGSQGAHAFAELVPPAIAMLPQDLRTRLRLTQQCRPEDLDRAAAAYRDARVNVELAPFFDDLPDRVARSHLVIARSGASTVAELCVLGRPAILVPLPGSIDADQKNNALVVDGAGGGWIAEQATLSPQLLASRIEALLRDPEGLARAAQAARGLGQPKAVERLADLAESQVGQRQR